MSASRLLEHLCLDCRHPAEDFFFSYEVCFCAAGAEARSDRSLLSLNAIDFVALNKNRVLLPQLRTAGQQQGQRPDEDPKMNVAAEDLHRESLERHRNLRGRDRVRSTARETDKIGPDTRTRQEGLSESRAVHLSSVGTAGCRHFFRCFFRKSTCICRISR